MDSNECVGFWISSLLFRNDLIVDLDAGQLVLVIGPNNAGKSTMLRELQRSLSLSTGKQVILKKVTIDKSGSSDALRDWVNPQPACKQDPYSEPKSVLLGGGGPIEKGDFESWVKPPLTKSLLAQLCTYITYGSRMRAVSPAKSFDPLGGVPEHPFQSVLKYPELEEQINQFVKQAFGLSVVLDQAAGAELPAYCVKTLDSAPNGNRVSREYLQWLRKHQRLDLQGDGLKSYVGCLLEFFAHDPFVMFVDEPEVFLHPPQARLLGRTLARERRQEQQLFVATHSAEFLKGALEAKSGSVCVIRLSRGKDGGEAASILHERIAEIWNDPTLRYSNTLDALFHEAVVICEADSDCKFYQWIAGGRGDRQEEDIMFLPTGGKGRVASVMTALKALGVPCAAILDADALREKHILSALVKASGGTWETLRPLWDEINEASIRLATTLAKSDLLEQVKKIVMGYENKFVTEKLVEQIRQVVRIESGWSLFKRSGLAALPSGSASKAAEKLVGELAKLGIFVVPVGEIEGFARSIPGHGPSWVAAVLEAYSPDASALSTARGFIDQVLAGLSIDGKHRTIVTPHVARPPVRPRRRVREWMRVLRDFNMKHSIISSVIFMFLISIIIHACVGAIFKR